MISTRTAFTTVKQGDPDYYSDASVDEMMAELGKEKHVPWFQQAYDKYVEGKRFADQILVLQHTLVSLLEKDTRALNLGNFRDKTFMMRAGSSQRR